MSARRVSARIASAAFFWAGSPGWARPQRRRSGPGREARSISFEWLEAAARLYYSAAASGPFRARAKMSLESTPVPRVVPDGLRHRAPRRAAGPVGELAAFHLGRTPVTNAQYAPFVAVGRAVLRPSGRSRLRGPDLPVVGVTWFEAVAFADWLAETLGGRWRLPSEAEWERAMRGGLEGAPTPWGDAVPSGEVPEGPLEGPWPVGRGTPNGFGFSIPAPSCTSGASTATARSRPGSRSAPSRSTRPESARAAAARGGTAYGGRLPPLAAACLPTCAMPTTASACSRKSWMLAGQQADPGRSRGAARREHRETWP